MSQWAIPQVKAILLRLIAIDNNCGVSFVWCKERLDEETFYYVVSNMTRYNRLINFLNKINMLSNNQYGFRKKPSTDYALIQLYDTLSDAIDLGKVTLGLFINLSKAFDTVNHDILLAKLEFYGVRGVALQWFKSYLSCRTQFVQYNGYNSSSKYIKFGVPQGSILGPLLFLLYINDLCNVSKALDFILLADDTNIFFSHNDPNQLMEIVNNELKKLSSWLQANKLSINIQKISNFILFKAKQNRQKLDRHFSINDSEIDRLNEVQFCPWELYSRNTYLGNLK